MTQPQPPESTNNHRSETESPSFVKRGKLWVPDTVQSRRSLLQRIWHWTGFKEKKLWDVLQLLIVPTALAIGAFYLQETAKQRDLQIADDRAKQETLNRYFDQISTLLFEQKLRTTEEGSEARIISRARTLTALRNLDGDRRGDLIRFVAEAKLIQGEKPTINLTNADLFKADLTDIDLSEVNLSEAVLIEASLREATLIRTNLNGVFLHKADLREANLNEANLSEAILSKANLSKSNLSNANLTKAFLFQANLSRATLSRADLTKAGLVSANLSNVNLSNTNLNGALLHWAVLEGANLDGAILDGAILLKANLSNANLNIDDLKNSYLCKTTMPDGTKSDRDCDKFDKRGRIKRTK